ncbi:hypothetical protein ACN38_g5911 [Penicillium nordicum]|uniref:Uncharacterized protein n=1 Tax=Penicillium nordicum TaxID=229535 RepID=A0A0N0RYU4_9EURO|nr:hypothetical protein ACN38_g5911 [Penicillium nordicum]
MFFGIVHLTGLLETPSIIIEFSWIILRVGMITYQLWSSASRKPDPLALYMGMKIILIDKSVFLLVKLKF